MSISETERDAAFSWCREVLHMVVLLDRDADMVDTDVDCWDCAS